METREAAKRTIADLISTIGGQLGLWLGASLLSLIDAVDFFCRNWIFIIIRKLKKILIFFSIFYVYLKITLKIYKIIRKKNMNKIKSY